MTRFDLSLYLVLDQQLCQPLSLSETTARAIAGGVTMVQLRDKQADTAQLIAMGRDLKKILAGKNIPLIVNDDLEAALALQAEGLHIGQDDMPAREARARLGGEKILGLSIESPAAMARLDPALVDYIGLGPVFATATKSGHKPAIGIKGLQQLNRRSPLPTVAIGGLKLAHVPDILACGVAGLAVVSAICGQPDPEVAARSLSAAITSWRNQSHFHKA